MLEWCRRLKKPKDADKEEMKDSKAVRLQSKLGVGPFWTPLYGAPPAPRALTQVCVHVCVFSFYLGFNAYVCVVYSYASSVTYQSFLRHFVRNVVSVEHRAHGSAYAVLDRQRVCHVVGCGPGRAQEGHTS